MAEAAARHVRQPNERAVEMKAGIVERDETEEGERALLNLGHTFCHALEKATGYGERLLHGEGVAIGCALAFELSVTQDLTQLGGLWSRRPLMGIAFLVGAAGLMMTGQVPAAWSTSLPNAMLSVSVLFAWMGLRSFLGLSRPIHLVWLCSAGLLLGQVMLQEAWDLPKVRQLVLVLSPPLLMVCVGVNKKREREREIDR